MSKSPKSPKSPEQLEAEKADKAAKAAEAKAKKAAEAKEKSEAPENKENEQSEGEHPSDPAPADKKPVADKKSPGKEEPKVKVLGKVNMTCLDGSRLVVGKLCHISLSEAERLKKDSRGPFFEE
jgi:sRNA-binding protein